MLLTIDIGNTNIVLGCVDDNKTYFIERLSTIKTKMELEYAIDIKTILDIHHINRADIGIYNREESYSLQCHPSR